MEQDLTVRRFIELLYKIGVWPENGESELRKSRNRILLFLQHVFFLIYLLAGSNQAYKNGENAQFLFLVYIVIAVSVHLLKLTYLLWRKDFLLKFLNDAQITHCNANRDELVLVNYKNRKMALFNKAYAVLVFIATLIAIFLPINSSQRKELPYFIHFNVNSDYETPLYWMAYVYLSAGTAFNCIYSFVMLIIWYILFNFSIEYELLGERLSRLGTSAPHTFRNDLFHVIETHRNLYETTERFRSLFSKLFLVEIVVGAASICISIYNLSYNTPENLFEMAFNVVMAMYAFSEIFCLMYLANEITLRSDRLAYCLFESNWIGQPESTKKLVIVFAEIIREPQHMTVYIYPMNLDKFMSIVNGAYSMFNILQSFK